MGKAEVLALLREDEYISGEEISRQLGISRAAVCKAVSSLRTDGCLIDAVTNRGYCLKAAAPEESRLRALLQDCPWNVRVLRETDSTNNALKREPNAPHGSVLIAARQSGGRGRLGRCFSSPPGGLYLSVLLRPRAEAAELLHLTPMAAVAVRRAIQDCCGISAQIKWINDIVAEGKKLCGILTELSGEAGSGTLSAIIGIGINCNTLPQELPEAVRPIAVSLRQLLGKPLDANLLAAALVHRLYEMDAALLTQKNEWMQEYASACLTLGKQVQILRGRTRTAALAEGIDENGCLRVRYENGETALICAGEVSVRGMYGYI